MHDKSRFVPFKGHRVLSIEESTEQAASFLTQMNLRRTIREFSSKDVPVEVINSCLLAAGTAPSGANLQPWHFVVVRDKEIKKKIREAAEKEEREFYKHRAPEAWLTALEPLGTDEHKEFLETAPCLIVIFAKSYEIDEDGNKTKNYYVQESVGIATGMLITAVHKAGLVSLTHTPSPMDFLRDVLGRPKNERPFLILVVGHPAKHAVVPKVASIKKPLSDIATFI